MKCFIHFLNGNDKNIQLHYSAKGYRDDIIIQIENKYFDIYFYQPEVVKYEYTGEGFFSMPGLIIVDAIEHEKLLKSLRYLIEIGYFKYMIGKNEINYKKEFQNMWYVNEMSSYDKTRLVSQELYL